MSHENKLEILLQQIEFPSESRKHFKNGSLEKLIVYKENKQWDFHIKTEKPLSFHIFYSLIQQLEGSCNNIAKVDVVLSANEEVTDEKELYLYWRYYIAKLEDMLPSHVARLESAQITNNQINIFVGSDAELVTLQKKTAQSYRSFFERYNLRQLKLNIEVRHNQTEIDDFRQQTEIENEQFVRKMKENQVNNEHKRKQAKKQSKFLIGTAIREEPVRLENILEEEKRITVQGYVFNKEIRNLRSGRQLLLLKITDYTSSLELKLFSRNEEQEQIFSQAKEGMWIKARGRVQTDQFSKDRKSVV